MKVKILNEIMFGDPKLNIISGGDSSNPSWEEYMDYFLGKYKEHLMAIKSVLKENNMIGMTGEEMQNQNVFLNSVMVKYGDLHGGVGAI